MEDVSHRKTMPLAAGKYYDFQSFTKSGVIGPKEILMMNVSQSKTMQLRGW